MDKILILYRSKYGASARYAAMLEAAADVRPLADWRRADLASYDALALIGGVYAGGVSGLSEFRRCLRRFRGKRAAVFCVGASPPCPEALSALRARCLRGGPAGLEVFYGRGAWDPARMTRRDRLLCRMLQASLAKRPPADLEPWMRALLEAGDQPRDWTDPADLAPLLAYLRGA